MKRNIYFLIVSLIKSMPSVKSTDSNLISAIKNNSTETVRKLLAEGANPNTRYCFLSRGYIDYFQPALNVALRCTDERGFGVDIPENTSLVAALLEFGADINGKDTDGFTPIRLAALHGWRDTVHLLLENGADINALDNQGQTPLMMAVMWNHLTLANEMLQRGADINIQSTAHGITALMHAVNRPHLASLRVLLDWGADIDLKDRNGRTVFSLLEYRKEMPDVQEAIALLEHFRSQK